ncbi:MAG: hypothetical protein ACAI38_06940 [Myxococcota bacterium]
MTIRPSDYHASSLALLRARGSFRTQLLDSVRLSNGPALAKDAFADVKVDNKRHAYNILKYAKEFFADDAPTTTLADLRASSRQVPVSSLAPTRAILDLLTAPVEASPTTKQGQARKTLREELGISSPLCTLALNLMLLSRGAQCLAGCHVIYNGHATGATMPLFPMLQALGLSSGGYRASSYSGDKGVRPLFNMVLSQLMGTPARDFNLTADRPENVVAELMTPGIVVVVNAGPMLNGMDLPPEVLQRIKRGDIRFVLHNSADHSAFDQLRAKYPDVFAQALCIDAANSVPKQMELDLIGAQIVAHGDDASRRHNGAPLKDSVSVIMGLGKMGRSIAQHLLGSNLKPENLVIVDTNPTPEAIAWAAERGITIHSELPETISGDRRLAEQPHGVVFVATNSPSGLDASHLPNLPSRTAVINTNSQGQGVDVDGIYDVYQNIQEADHDYRAWGLRDGDHRGFSDMVCVRDQACKTPSPKALTLVNLRHDPETGRVSLYSPNLSDTTGQDDLPTTPMIVIGVCAASDPDLKPRHDGRPHPFPLTPGNLLKNAALPALPYYPSEEKAAG